MGAEGSCGKNVPSPFLASIFRFFRAILLAFALHFMCPFWFGCFERSKPCRVFALVLCLCRRYLGSDLLKGRSPLAFLHLLCVCAEGFLVRTFLKGRSSLAFFALVVRLCRRFFGSDLLKGRSPLAFLHLLCVCFDKYAKFADSASFANLLFCLACRCLPKLAILAA